MANAVFLSIEQVLNIPREYLSTKKLSARWLPILLNEDKMQRRVMILNDYVKNEYNSFSFVFVFLFILLFVLHN